MIQAYQGRQRRNVILTRAATVGTAEAFDQVLSDAFPKPTARAGSAQENVAWPWPGAEA